MPIIRSETPKKGFRISRNEVDLDDNLSYRARGVLGAILARPDSWRIESTALARRGPEGRDAIRTALQELIDERYVIRHKSRGEGGRWVTSLYAFDQKQAPEAIAAFVPPTPENPASEDQSSEDQSSEDQSSGSQALLVRTESKDREQEPTARTESKLAAAPPAREDQEVSLTEGARRSSDTDSLDDDSSADGSEPLPSPAEPPERARLNFTQDDLARLTQAVPAQSTRTTSSDVEPKVSGHLLAQELIDALLANDPDWESGRDFFKRYRTAFNEQLAKGKSPELLRLVIARMVQAGYDEPGAIPKFVRTTEKIQRQANRQPTNGHPATPLPDYSTMGERYANYVRA